MILLRLFLVQMISVKFYPDSYLKMYEEKKIVYLTSESENVIDTLEPDCVYVIGGLVDHNSHKGHCHKLAIQEKVGHARLPLDKFLKMKARKVLTVDHVFEILLRVTEGKTWQKAFLQVLPERKNAQPVLPTKPDFSEDSLDCKSALYHDDVKITEETMNKTEMEEDNGA